MDRNAATTMLVGIFDYNVGSCAGAPAKSKYIYAVPGGCTMFTEFKDVHMYYQADCTAPLSPSIGYSFNSTCSPLEGSVQMPCSNSGWGEVTSSMLACREVDVSTVVTVFFHMEAECKTSLRLAAIFPINECSSTSYPPYGTDSTNTKFSVDPKGNITISSYEFGDCGNGGYINAPPATPQLITTVAPGSCIPWGTTKINDTDVPLFLKAQLGVPWTNGTRLGAAPTTLARNTSSPSVPSSGALASVTVVSTQIVVSVVAVVVAVVGW